MTEPRDEMPCPVCEEVAWRGAFPVEDGDKVDCLSCNAELVVRVDCSIEVEGADGFARLRKIG